MFHSSSGRLNFTPIENVQANNERTIGSNNEPTLKRKRKIKDSSNKVVKIEPLRLEPKSRNDWRTWLEFNHDKERAVWVIFFNKAANVSDMVNNEELIEEALCFGWTQSAAERIDDKRSSFRFTPRSVCSKWSAANKRRAKQLIMDGKMTEHGLAKMTNSVKKQVLPDVEACNNETK
jgi:uncharacterized protein YdeI (YjbR/CyaY-like superfamily)